MRRAARARQPLYSRTMPAPLESRESSPPPATLPLPRAPALVVAPRHAVWLDEDGVLARLSHREVRERLAAPGPAPYVCHAKAIVRRLGLSALTALDVLELFAFVHPARLAVPTVRGLARALGLALPESTEDEAATLHAAAARLLGTLASPDPAGAMDAPASPGLAGAMDAPAIARTMARAGWPWGDAVVAALEAGGRTPAGSGRADDQGPLAVWSRLKEWQESAPPAAPGHDPVAPGAARKRLAHLLGDGAEPRPEQADYASAACAAFDPMETEEQPHVVLAEAGTGVGKTLGYIAPASLWAERNEGTVWLSTFTRNLQRQIDQELDRLYPEPRAKAEKVVLRKGRENYFCLLNMEEAVGRSRAGAGGAHRARPDGALGGGDAGRRLDRRRPARLARRPARLRPHARARGPARRVHPRRVHALPPLLHREEPAQGAARGHGDRQPRAAHGAGGTRRLRHGRGARRAHALRARRGAPPLRRGGQRLLRAPHGQRGAGAQALAARTGNPEPRRRGPGAGAQQPHRRSDGGQRSRGRGPRDGV